MQFNPFAVSSSEPCRSSSNSGRRKASLGCGLEEELIGHSCYRAFKLAEQWVNSMRDDSNPNENVLESQPPKLGIGAAVPRQSQTLLSNDPVERKLRAKLDAEKRRKLNISEASTISAKDDQESDEEESKSKTRAFKKKK